MNMASIYNSVEELIGSTPLLRLEKIEKAYIELLQENERKDITISLISEKAKTLL